VLGQVLHHDLAGHECHVGLVLRGQLSQGVHQALAEIRHTAAYLGDDPPVKGHALKNAADTLEAALYEPTEQDWADFHAWCREQDEHNQDLEDARRESEYQDMLERSARFTDEDLEAAGLPVG